MPCCVRHLSSMQVCAVVCGPVARLDGQVIGPAAGTGCLHARRLLEGPAKPWATGKGVRCAEIKSAGWDAVLPAALPVWGCGSREASRRTQSNLCWPFTLRRMAADAASTGIWINLRIKGGLIMALGRPRRKVLGQGPHPALARTRALPRKINRRLGDSGDGEPGEHGGVQGNRKAAARSSWRMLHGAGGRLDDGERMASGN